MRLCCMRCATSRVLWHTILCKRELPEKATMEIKILDRKENILLKREEIEAGIEQAGATPSRKVVTAEAAKKLGVDESLLIVDKISTERGKSGSFAKFLVYKKMEEIPKYKITKSEKRLGIDKNKATEAQISGGDKK